MVVYVLQGLLLSSPRRAVQRLAHLDFLCRSILLFGLFLFLLFRFDVVRLLVWALPVAIRVTKLLKQLPLVDSLVHFGDNWVSDLVNAGRVAIQARG